ncbi:MAG: replication-associated recombination protein A [Verrucomicrobiota bacterium]
MEDLFGTDALAPEGSVSQRDARQNLAYRMRPRHLDEFIGQKHLLAEGKLLHRLITSDRISAVLLHGPPGTGKTSLAHCIANMTENRFVALNAVEATVGQLRKTIEIAQQYWDASQKSTVVLIDEIHRFNKAQQDAILPHLEAGRIKLVGATTQNPFFAVNSALISRMQLFELKSLSREEIQSVIRQALNDEERGYGSQKVEIDREALLFLSEICEGDSRRALNALEIAVLSSSTDTESLRITQEVVEESIQKKSVQYDRDGDQHYDTISAFIKTIRGSEPDAAIYLLAKMLEAGEDIRFIARRLVISAAEDVGLADPRALQLAVSCQQAVEFIGLPEARIPLAETTIYLATAPKSNRAYAAINKAIADIKKGRTLEIPTALKDTSYASAKKLGRGDGYQYAHNYEDGIAPKKMFICPEYFEPSNRGFETKIRERLEAIEELRRKRNP